MISLTLLLALSANSHPLFDSGDVELPQGNAPAPVELKHFPSRYHAFVWRNWSLVPIDRMSAAIGAAPMVILKTGKAMGLPDPPRISRDQARRSYLTVIRRNWHLLPYEQLLKLLEWTPEELAFTLREDDFLYTKLGSHKPKCEPVTPPQASEAIKNRERRIAAIVKEMFRTGERVRKEPLFAFVEQLSRRPSGQKSPASQKRQSEQVRFCYSYFALYGDPLLDGAPDPYPDGLLSRLEDAGVTGVWLQAVLYKLAPFPWDTTKSDRHEERIRNLTKLVKRAGRYGIRVYLYLNEPRAMPVSFFQGRESIRGVAEGDHATMCTSVPEVQNYLRDSVSAVSRAVPDLGGFFTITASENLTNCWSHYQGAGCPRCSKRSAAEVVAEVNRLIHEGIRAGGSMARLVAWDWGWQDSWASAAIKSLPKDAALMSVSEWSLPIQRGGIKSEIGEYSVSTPGPGPRASRHWAEARRAGLSAFAKIQAANSWELSAIPYIPAVALTARHAANLRNAGVDGIMLGWTLGGYPSPNLEVTSAVMRGAESDSALHQVAQRRYGQDAERIVEFWKANSAAFTEFPYNIGTVYTAPMQFGPSNLLWESKTNYRATMIGFPYDDLTSWRSIYPAEVFIAQMEKVAGGFRASTEKLRSKGTGRAAESEARLGDAAALHFQSTANQCRFVLARDKLSDNPDSTPSLAAELESVVRAEMNAAKSLYILQSVDSRIGFEASNHYYYVPLDLIEKVLNCRDLLDRWLPAVRATFGRPQKEAGH